jgi:hypothetical protein
LEKAAAREPKTVRRHINAANAILEARAEVVEMPMLPRMIQVEARIVWSIVAEPMIVVDVRPGIHAPIGKPLAFAPGACVMPSRGRRGRMSAICSVLPAPLRKDGD